MSNPQLENRYLSIANEIADKFCCYRINCHRLTHKGKYTREFLLKTKQEKEKYNASF